MLLQPLQLLMLMLVCCVQIAEKFPAEFEARKRDKLRYRWGWDVAAAPW